MKPRQTKRSHAKQIEYVSKSETVKEAAEPYLEERKDEAASEYATFGASRSQLEEAAGNNERQQDHLEEKKRKEPAEAQRTARIAQEAARVQEQLFELDFTSVSRSGPYTIVPKK